MAQGEENLLEQAVELLRELVAYTRAANHLTITKVLETILDSDDKRLVYQLSDGDASARDIQRLSGVNKDSISEWWREWEQIGIAQQSRSSNVKGRRQRLFSLSDFGIAVPEPKDSDRRNEG
jgi:hypothetical protein